MYMCYNQKVHVLQSTTHHFSMQASHTVGLWTTMQRIQPAVQIAAGHTISFLRWHHICHESDATGKNWSRGLLPGRRDSHYTMNTQHLVIFRFVTQLEESLVHTIPSTYRDNLIEILNQPYWNIMATLLKYYGNLVEILWQPHWNIMATSLKYYDNLIEISWPPTSL